MRDRLQDAVGGDYAARSMPVHPPWTLEVETIVGVTITLLVVLAVQIACWRRERRREDRDAMSRTGMKRGRDLTLLAGATPLRRVVRRPRWYSMVVAVGVRAVQKVAQVSTAFVVSGDPGVSRRAASKRRGARTERVIPCAARRAALKASSAHGRGDPRRRDEQD